MKMDTYGLKEKVLIELHIVLIVKHKKTIAVTGALCLENQSLFKTISLSWIYVSKDYILKH